MGARLSTAATAASGTKAASSPRKRYRGLRKYRCYTATGEGGVEIIANWGRFKRIARPGFNCVWCCFGQNVAGRLSTALQARLAVRALGAAAVALPGARQLHQEVQCECKTADGVFVELVLSLQYRVAQDRLYEAFYSMDDPQAQVTSYVLDALGTTVAAMPIEQLFAHREEMVHAVQRGLESLLHSHGFALEDCLITVLAPTQSVKEAMNNVLAAQRQREAAFEQGEADKVRTVKGAEASAESKYLQGQGLARFFIALTAGLRESAKVLLTGRIKQEDLTFPQPPPGDDRAALEAAGVSPMPPAAAEEDGQQEAAPAAAASPAGPAAQQPLQGRPAGQAKSQVQVQREWREQPAGGRAGHKAPPGVVASSSQELGQSLLDARPAALSTLPAKPAQQAKQHMDPSALLPPHAPGTPSHGGAASAGMRSGGAQLGKMAAGL
ncbi:Hypersensitive-induced response [Chlorella sorokiniana]|uniref:Hypersensitive-induced response n=1 Tax=Chlorella sorokiniana TaxID=3076 RepID=A0A2P6TN90_CHLSO|nr:Hypersensitive-induced response [Chlorella sorokiniana]|eukprot:PRW50800.1 Hypersensitive-induced response [Chlorella sorokiniana]